MPIVDVQVNVEGVCRAIEHLEREAKDVDLEVLAAGIVSAIDDLIDSGGRGRWPGLSPTTIKLHPRRAGGKLLQDTGQLAAIQTDTGPDWARIMSPAPYAGFHLEPGTDQDNIYHAFAPHHMPARDFLAIDLPAVLEETAALLVQEVANR